MRPVAVALASCCIAAALPAACAVPDPGVGDTLPPTPPLLAPPVVLSYRHLAANPITDPTQFPDSELIDVYLPSAIGPGTGVLLWVHGGGWVGGDRKFVPAWVLQQVPRGYLVDRKSTRLNSSH